MTAADHELTIDGLVAAAALAVSAAEVGQQSGRVGEVPGLRAVRYYTTVGLLDRPSELRGRTALYGRRHLLQLVAIKRLQARGLSLAEIQERLYGLPDGELERIAHLPAAGTTRRAPRRTGAFWKEAPVPAGSAAPPVARPTTALSLSSELLLVFPAERPLDDEDRASIIAAAEPLRRLLHQRRLLRRTNAGKEER